MKSYREKDKFCQYGKILYFRRVKTAIYMAKKRRKRNKRSGFLKKALCGFLKKTLCMTGVALAVGACIHGTTDGKQLTSHVGKVVEQAQVAVEQAREGVEQLQRMVEQTGNATRKTTHPTGEGWEIPAMRPSDKRVLVRTGYTLSYNDEWKTPNWVAWELTPEELKGKVKRTDFFEADPDLPARVRSEHRDYSGSRYDRGHMAPAGDMKWDEQAMVESFYMSNMCPQAPNLNKGEWRILEEQCRRWTQRGRTPLYIVCGPIVEEGKNHKRIGRAKVTVPDAFFKVVLRLGKTPAAVGFIFPNDDCTAPLSHYAVPVDEVEAITGIDFFPRLPDEQEKALEATNGMEKF